MIKKEEIVGNMKKFIATSTKYGILTPELEKLIGEDLLVAPASTMTKLHNAFEGGLVDHILRVMKKAYEVNDKMIPELKVPAESLIKVVYLHQIGKCGIYVKETSEWHIKNQGKMYNFKEDITSMSIGERSIFYALSSGVTLTQDEYVAILNHDKTDDLQSEWHNSVVGDILKVAIRLAIIEEKSSH